MEFTDAELKMIYDLLALEVQGRDREDLPDNIDIDNAFEKIAAELVLRGIYK